MPKQPTESIGSFDEREALTIASALKMDCDIHASVERLIVDSGPTDWYLVHVSGRDHKIARAWMRGYRTGRACLRIEDNPHNAALWPEYAALIATLPTDR